MRTFTWAVLIIAFMMFALMTEIAPLPLREIYARALRQELFWLLVLGGIGVVAWSALAAIHRFRNRRR